MTDPGRVLSTLGTTALDLYAAFVLGSKPGLRDQLAAQVELVAGPDEQLSDRLRAGDLLLRGQTGEGEALLAVLADATLLNPAQAARAGWDAESSLPGCYARVTEDVTAGQPADGTWARRITDRHGIVLPSQAILRLSPGGAALAGAPRPQAAAASPDESAPAEASSPATPPALTLSSPRFTGDPDLQAVIAGGAPAGRARHPGLPGPGAQHRPGHRARSAGPAGPRVPAAQGRCGRPVRRGDRGGGGPVQGGSPHCARRPGRRPADAGRARCRRDRARRPPASTPAPAPAPGAALSTLESRYFPPPGGTDAAPISRLGSITPLIDGVTYFAAIKTEIDQLRAGDIFYLTDWWLDPGFRFAPGTPTLRQLLTAKAAAGVDVRVILSANRNLLALPQSVLSGLSNVCRGNVAAAETLRGAPGPAGGTHSPAGCCSTGPGTSPHRTT